MTPLQQTALDFCRGCMGWADAYHSGDGYVVSRNAGDPKVWTPGQTADLNTVLRLVHGWCNDHGLSVNITSQPTTKMFRWRVQITTDGYTLDNDLAHALLAACVEANRKLKAAA